MKANLNNIMYIEYEGRYHILVEYSRLPIETFGSERAAKGFIEGYLHGNAENEYNRKGKLFRKFVDMDIQNGMTYGKVSEIAQVSA